MEDRTDWSHVAREEDQGNAGQPALADDAEESNDKRMNTIIT